MKVWHINNIASVGPTLVDELTKQGVEARFIDLPKPLALMPGFLKILGLPIRFAFARKILREAREQNVDLLHVHYTTSVPWFLFGGVPVVAHAHGSDARIPWWSWIRHLLNWIVCRNAAAVFYATPDMERHVGRYTSHGKFSPNPVDVKTFAPPSVVRKPHLIFINAALDPIKGAGFTLEAVKKLKHKFPQLHFQTIRLGKYVRRAAGLGVEMLPKARREDLPAILGKAGMILGQFKVGAIGMSELEVLSTGRTVACHFEYGDVYDEAPPFVQASTADEIFAAVEKYVANERVYHDLEDRARGWVMKYHNSETVAAEVLSVYKTILASAPRSTARHNTPAIPEHSSGPHKSADRL